MRPLQTEFVALVRSCGAHWVDSRLAACAVQRQCAGPTSGGTYGWVGAGKPKPVGELDLATVQVLFAKACGILVTTEELISLGSPAAEVLLRDDLVRGAAGFLDAQFIDPAVAAVANVNPASITNTATQICRVASPRRMPTRT